MSLARNRISYMRASTRDVVFGTNVRTLLDAGGDIVDLADSGPAGRTLIKTGNVASTGSISGFDGAAAFPGGANYLGTGNSAGGVLDPQSSNNRTYEAIITPTVVNTQMAIMGQWNNPPATLAQSEWRFYVSAAGRLTFECINQTPGSAVSVADTVSLVAGTTYKVAAVFNGSSIFIYKNGVQVGSLNITAAGNDSTTQQFFIGFTGSTPAFQGTIDEVRISDTVRYTANYTPATAPFVSDANTLVLYHMDAINGGGDGSGADTNFTVTYTSTTAITQTVNPYINISNVATDNRTTLGWAFNQNEFSASGMGSISTRKRYIPAGVWNFQYAWTSNAAALLANYNVIISYHVYRVAANAGARTLLFSATAATVNVTSLGAGSGNGAAASASQPDYILEPNETIHVAVQINSAATSAVLGAVTNTVITCTRATTATAFVTVPAPGIRDITLDSNSAIGEGSGSRSNLVDKDYAAIGEGSGIYGYMSEFFRTFNGIGAGLADRDLLTVMKFVESVGRGVGTRSLKVSKDTINAVGEGDSMRYLLTRKDIQTATGEGSGTYDYLAEFFRTFSGIGEGDAFRSNLVRKDIQTANGKGAGVISRSLQLFRALNAIGKGDAFRSMLVHKDVITALGEGDGDLAKAAIFVRVFNAIGEGFATEEETVIFVREFMATGKATIRPRIALDWDDLPDAGGGGATINVYRPLFVFDD